MTRRKFIAVVSATGVGLAVGVGAVRPVEGTFVPWEISYGDWRERRTTNLEVAPGPIESLVRICVPGEPSNFVVGDVIECSGIKYKITSVESLGEYQSFTCDRCDDYVFEDCSLVFT